MNKKKKKKEERKKNMKRGLSSNIKREMRS